MPRRTPETATPTTDKRQLLQDLMTGINKNADRTCITFAKNVRPRRTRHSGSIALDIAIGGGLPKGGMVEFSGDPGVGKTTIGYHALAACQRAGEMATLLDIEGRADQQRDLRMRCGVDEDTLGVARFSWCEEFLSTARSIVESRLCGVMLVDSIGGMAPMEWKEKTQEKPGQVAGVAKLMNQFVRLIPAAMCTGSSLDEWETYNDTTVMFVNHLYQKIGGFARPGLPPPKITTGGRGTSYMCLLTVQVRADQAKVDKDTGVSVRELNFVAKKSSIGPEREGTLRLLSFGDQMTIDNRDSLWKACRGHDLLEAGGKEWYFHDAAKRLTDSGTTIPMGGKGPTAEQFVSENMEFCLAQVFKVEQAAHSSFAPWDVAEVDTVTIKGETYPLSKFTGTESAEG